MSEHINRVFIDGQYRYNGLAKKDLAATKAEFRASAVKVLADTGADHAVYCHIEYNEDESIKSVSFYSDLTMDDATFYERTKGVAGFIGAVHKNGAMRPVIAANGRPIQDNISLVEFSR